MKEEPLTFEEQNNIGAAFDTVIENELAFIHKIFEGRSLSTASAYDLEAYVKYRANDRLEKLGINKTYLYDVAAAERIKQWFNPLAAGMTSTDFFAQSKDGSNYISKPIQDFSGVNLKLLDLVIS